MTQTQTFLFYVMPVIVGIILFTATVIPVYADDPDIARILVPYTQSAANDLGGEENMMERIKESVSFINTVFNNNGIGNLKVELAGFYKVDYTEPSTNVTKISLNDLVGKDDDKLDEVHDVREAVGADVVIMYIHESNEGGRAKGNVDVKKEFAFGVINTAKPIESFAHEFAHGSIGIGHPDDPETSPYNAYCLDNEFRTIAGGGCEGVSERRIPYFSSDIITPTFTIDGKLYIDQKIGDDTHKAYQGFIDRGEDFSNLLNDICDSPPKSGDWIITEGCVINDNIEYLNGDIIIENLLIQGFDITAGVIIRDGASLTFSSSNSLIVKENAGILIQHGGAIKSVL